MNMVHQKIKFSTPSFGEAAILSTREIKELSESLKNAADVHFRAKGIAEVAVIDPTVGNEEIRIMTVQDQKRLGISDE